jgi:hypothetical protein
MVVGFDCFTRCTRFKVGLCFHELADYRGLVIPGIAGD